MWYIENKHSGKRLDLEFSLRENAQERLENMGGIFLEEYRLVHESGDTFVDRILTEGLEKGDLHRILLPRLSIDEYVPANTHTDNVVIAFFIKGEPNAVVPFKNFCEHSNGVLDVDYGDSDTIMNTSVVYVEMDRENLDIKDIHELLTQTAMIGAIEVADFTMTFPHTNAKFPYNPKLLKRYFDSRNRRKNMLAQRKAEKKAQANLDRQLRQGDDTGQAPEGSPEGTAGGVPMESMKNRLVKKFLEG